MAFALSPSDYLVEAVQSRVADMGRHLGEGADAHLHELARAAVAKLKEDHGEVSPDRLQQAHDDLIELVEKAEEIALGLEDYPDDLLGERSYFPAFGWFCPRYPFC